MTNVLEVENLKVHFPTGKGGKVHAVDGLSFTLAPGTAFGLVGESGSGKTTAAMACARLTDITSGTVRLNGRDLGLAWTWPYEFDATGAVIEGRNRLEVEVTGTWHNRLRYDAARPKEKRKTWTLGWPDPATTLPQPTGLFGPVRIVR